jgi:hypothetical protein
MAAFLTMLVPLCTVRMRAGLRVSDNLRTRQQQRQEEGQPHDSDLAHHG